MKLVRGKPAAAVILACSFTAASAQIPGDAQRGREIFRSSGCARCHDPSETPGSFARFHKRYGTSRAGLAAAMWRHAPLLWSEGITLHVTEQGAADLFSYFYADVMAARAGRVNLAGDVLESKRCSRCHSPSIGSFAPPPTSFGELIRIAWNHSTRASASRPRLPKLTETDAWKLIGWLVLQTDRGSRMGYSPLSAEQGRRVFEEKGCTGCHRYPPANRFPARSPAQFIAALWNHASYGVQSPALSDTEARQLLGYLWVIHYFDERGDVAVGRSVFEKKHCAGCHEGLARQGPRLAGDGKKRTSMWLITRLCEHAPAMYERVREAGITWPRLKPLEAADILQYLNSLKSLRLRRAVAPVR